MTTVLDQFSGAWLVSSRMFPNFGFAFYEALLGLTVAYSIGCHTLSRHVASNQSVELRDVVAPIVSSDASELANTVSSLLSMHSCHKNRCIAAPTISSA